VQVLLCALQYPEVRETISVHVAGAVQVDASILLPPAATVIDALVRVNFSEWTDIESLHLDEKLEAGQLLIVPKLNCLSVMVKGAVSKEGIVLLPEGMRFWELEQHLDLAPTADRKFFRRKKRLLKEGETIVVPELL
jgi:hypothetical protein